MLTHMHAHVLVFDINSLKSMVTQVMLHSLWMVTPVALHRPFIGLADESNWSNTKKHRKQKDSHSTIR